MITQPQTPGWDLKPRRVTDGGYWMAKPGGVFNCPSGLEYLTTLDQVLFYQNLERLEVFNGYETRNKYVIKNSEGQIVYYAINTPDDNCCNRNICNSERLYDMQIFDYFRNEVIQLYRRTACDGSACLLNMEVSSPPDTVIGTVEEIRSFWYAKFAIKNASGTTVLRIKGPCCCCHCWRNVELKVTSADGETQVGKIYKRRSSVFHYDFGVSFPIYLDVQMKAVMLGACFLIDSLFVENLWNQNDDISDD